MIEARHLAQIAVFLSGLFHLDAVFGSLVGLVNLSSSEVPVRLAHVLVPIGLTIFVLSLLLFSRGWAALVTVPGSASSLSDLGRDDLLRLVAVGLGLCFLVAGIADAVDSIVRWQQAHAAATEYGYGAPIEVPRYPEPAPFVRALLGAGLTLWGSQIPDLIHRLRPAGRAGGAA